MLTTGFFRYDNLFYFSSFKTVEDIPDYYFDQKRTITGKVLTVHDGDGFRLFHDEEFGIFSCFYSSEKAKFKRGNWSYFQSLFFNF